MIISERNCNALIVLCLHGYCYLLCAQFVTCWVMVAMTVTITSNDRAYKKAYWQNTVNNSAATTSANNLRSDMKLRRGMIPAQLLGHILDVQ